MKKHWKFIIAGLLVLSLAVAGVGFASAQGNGPYNDGAGPFMQRAAGHMISAIADALGLDTSELVKEIRSGKSVLKIAEEKNVDKDKIIQSVESIEKERLQKLVDEGKITQDQMDWVLSRSKERLDEFLEREGTGAPFRGRNPVAQGVWSAVAKELGMEEDTLRCELRNKSLAAIAEEKGVSMDEISKTMEEAYKSGVQKLVDEGKITQDQANAAIEQFDKHTEECLSQGEGLGCGWGWRAGMSKIRPFFNGRGFRWRPGKARRFHRNGNRPGSRAPANPRW